MLYLFEGYVLDTDRHELRRGAAAVPVEPQVFDVLTYLIQNRERVVTRDDLLAAVWEGRIVSESTLSSRINAARVAVGDNGEDQRLIRTVLRRGFRFVGPVREQKYNEPVALAGSPASPRVGSAGIDFAPSDRGESHGTDLVPVAEQPDTAGLQHGGPIRAPSPNLAPAAVTYRPRTPRAKVIGFFGAVVAAATAIVLLVYFHRPTPIARPVQKFDASVVPLVSDAHRRSLASYPNRPDAKALAIAYDLISVVDGISDIEGAKQAAIAAMPGSDQEYMQNLCGRHGCGVVS